MTEPKKTNEEVHGYDALDRLESESLERAPGTTPTGHGDSAYELFWLGEDSFLPGQ